MAESQQQPSTSQPDSQPSADQLLSALEKAHLAGDTQAAREFAAWHQELYATTEPEEPEGPGLVERGANALRSLITDPAERDIEAATPGDISQVADYGRRGPAPQRPASQPPAAPPPEARRTPAPGIDPAAASARSARNAPGAQAQRVDQRQPEPQAPEVDAFTGAARPAPEEAPDFNMARGAAERVGDLAGGALTAIGAAAESAEQAMPLGGFVWEEGSLLPRYLGGEEYARYREEGGEEALSVAAENMKELDAGYVPTHTWEAVKEEFGENGPLSGSAWAEVAAYGAEQGIKSVPDMVAVTLNLPGYVLARSGEIGEARALNKGKDEADLTDVLEAAPVALGSAILERIGARGITEAGAEAVGKEALKRGVGYAAARTAQEGTRAAGREAGTEFVQEGIIEYVGERFGTDAAMSFAEGAEMGVAGAVAGGVYGGAAGTATAGAREATRQSPEAELGRAMQQEADALQPTDDGSRAAAERLAPENAQFQAEPQGATPTEAAPARKSMGELVREKLAERGLSTPEAQGYRDAPSIAPAFSDDAEARAAWERAWRDQGMADPNADLPDTTIDIEGQRQPPQEAASEAQAATPGPTPSQGAQEGETPNQRMQRLGFTKRRQEAPGKPPVMIDPNGNEIGPANVDRATELMDRWEAGERDLVPAAPETATGPEARRRNRPLEYTGYSGETRQARSYDEVGDYRVAKVRDGLFEVIDPQGQTVSQRAGRQGAIDYARQLIAESPAQALRGEAIDSEWSAFSEASGTRGVPRAEMPQIKAEHRGALANFLAARGIESSEETVPAASLKPTQREYSEERVQAAKDRDGGDRAILVSSDGHIVDGHHQWLARADQGAEVRIIRLDAPIDQVLEQVRDMPSVEQEAEARPETPDDQPTATAYTPAGEPVEVRYRVVEAADLVASNDLEGNVNPTYPEAIQPRDRGRLASRAQMLSIAREPVPERLMESAETDRGAPVIGEDGVVESGNGRTVGLREAYRRGTADAYRQAVAEAAERLGLGDVSGMREPVLVRERATPMTDAQRRDFAAASNRGAGLGMSPAEQAASDARNLGEEDLAQLRVGDDGNVLAASNRDFLDRFADMLGANEAAQYRLADGQWNSAFRQRVERAIFASAYGDTELLTAIAESPNPELRNLLAAMMQAAPAMARLQALAPGEASDLAGTITEAVGTVSRSRSERQSLEEILGQGDMLGDTISEDAALLARLFDTNIRSARRLGAMLRSVADQMETAARNRDQPDLLTGEPAPMPTAGEAIRQQEPRNGQQPQAAGDLFSPATSSRPGEGDGRGQSPRRQGAAAEVAQEGQVGAPRPFAQAETGEPLRDTGYRVEGIDPATLYRGAQVPILGQGQYLATSADGARSFAQDDSAPVTETRVSLDSPLVIRSDNEWRALAKAAGWETPNPFGQRPEQVRQGVEALQSLARERGHDGIAVLWDNSTPYDIDEQGRHIKLLRDVFSEPQVVAFGKAQNPKASQPRRRRGDTSAMRTPTTRPGARVTAEQAEAELLAQMDEGDRQLFSDEEWQQVVDDQRQRMQREADAAANLPEGFEAFGDFTFDGQTLRRDGEVVGSLSLRLEGDGVRRLVIDDIRMQRRGQGAGTEAIRAIIDRAGELELPVTLTAETMQGQQTQRRLRDYYQRLGFTRNQGRDRVRGIAEEFYLAPEGVTLPRASRPRRGGDTSAMRMPDSPIEQGDIMAAHASPWADSPAETADMAGDVSNAGQDSPMPNWHPTYRQLGVLPRRPESGEFELGERTVQLKPEDKPTRREGIRVMVTDVIGPRLYQGKIKGKTKLGFYRRSNSEVRIANFDDVEVMAHEMAHYLDMHYRFNDRFSEAYNDPAFKGEVEGLSYTSAPNLRTTEGFAEFVRLWLTQYDEAQQRAPNFTAKFETVLARDKALDRKMTRLQEEMHRWYRQGDLAQAYAVTSGNQYTTGQQVTMLLNGRPGELWRQRYIDKIHAAKVMERTIGGDIADAGHSAYKQLQLLNGIEGISQESFKHGAPVIGEDGDITFKGPALKDVWSESLRKGPKVLREQELYFVARRAQELKRQGRERLISDGMMREGLAMADKHPHFVQAFDDYQTYRTNMMEFYVESGYVTADAARAMLKANQNYVPFHRVVEGVNAAYTGGAGFMRLKGGQQNIKPVYDNMMMQEQRHLYAALKARALRQLYSDALKHQDGSLFLSKIAPDSKPVEVAIDQMTNKTAEAMAEMGVSIAEDGAISGDGETVVDKAELQRYFEQHPEELMFWTFGHKPKTTETMVDSFIDGRGKRVWVEIQKDNQLLVDMLDNMDYVALPPGALGTAVKLAMRVKNFQTLTITSMAQFVGPNMVRDAQQAFALSGGKFKPGWDTMKGLLGQFHAILSDKAAWHEMKAQGGPVAGRVRTFYSENWGLASDVAYAPRKPFYHPQQMMHTLLDVYMAIADSAEIATRLGFYMRMRKEVGAREAAWQAREISTDFRKHGSYAAWVLLQRTVPFLGAYVQSVDRDIRALADNKGEMKLANLVKTESGRATLRDMKVRIWMTGSLIVATTALLALLNEDEERYRALTPDQKARFYHLFIGGRHYTIPKPHGFISLVAQGAEAVMDTMTSQTGRDAAEVMKFATAYHFGSDAMPGVINPVAEVALNRSFTGAPIVSRYAQDREARYQYDDRTPLLYVNVGRELNISPDQAHHLMRGYTGYLSDFVDELSEKLLWDNQEWGDRPFARDFGDMLNKQFKPREVPYRTKWTTGYYDLRRRAATAQANLSFLQREARRDTGPLEEFAADRVNGTLLGINKAFNRIDDAFSDQDAIIAGIKYDPDLTAEQKEAEIEAYYAQKNDALAEFYQQVDEALAEVEDEID